MSDSPSCSVTVSVLSYCFVFGADRHREKVQESTGHGAAIAA
ncbi:hypothetical protein [Halocatena pleomorpha]|nr:hypothetical protein [Halocatena pleomorpha]